MSNMPGRFIYAALIHLVFLVGCATTPPPQDKKTVFFPPPPALPYIQFLQGFSGAEDIVPEASAFDAFVTGSKGPKFRLMKPYGVDIYDGKIYVCDTGSTVMIFDLKEKKFAPMEGAKGMGKLVQPINITIDKQGNKFVTDPLRGQVVMFDAQDFYVRAYGMKGGWRPVDAAVFEDRLYVVDAENKYIRVFDLESGDWVKSIGKDGPQEERLGLPTNLSFDKNGTLYVADVGRFQVVKYDRDAHYLGKIGKVGANLGHFARPRGLAVDRSGTMYAVDASFDNVQMFTPEGQLLMFFGGAGDTPGTLSLPANVIIDYENIGYFQEKADPDFEIEHLVIVTSQVGEPLVNVYAFGRKKNEQYPSEEELREQLQKRVKEWQEEKPEAQEGNA